MKTKPTKSSLLRLSLGLCVLLCSGLPPARAEVIDRIVAIVDAHIITLSDLRQEREVRAQLGDKPEQDDLKLTNELTDAYLVDQQITDYPNLEVTDQEIQDAVETLNPKLSKASEAVRDAVRRRIRIQKFFDVKFRELIRPTEAEIQKYYDAKFVPKAREDGLTPIPPLTDPGIADKVRENVIQDKLDHEIDVWLEAIRKRSKVELLK